MKSKIELATHFPKWQGLPPFLICLPAILMVIISYLIFIKKSRRRVYMLDFACFKPPPSLKCTKEQSLEIIKRIEGNISGEELHEVMKIGMHKAGLGDSTYLSEALLRVPPNPSMATSRQEAEMVMFGAIDALLAKANLVNCKEDIGILIVNCSVFNVVPCLSTMIVHRYELREDIASYNVTGMGCSAGLIAIGLANNLLQVHPDQYALVVTTETITEQVYIGNDRSKIATNCIFRLGGSAILLSNRSADRKRFKYELLHTVHVNNASSDISYNSIFVEEDKDGLQGITITKDLLVAAKSAIESNLATLGPLILPLSEKLRFLENILVSKYQNAKMSFLHRGFKVVPTRYVPKFSGCIEHFFPHVGAKPVLDELQRILRFSECVMEAPRMSLHRFGNTSSSSVWYEMAYSEAKGRIKKGERLWQIAFGSGFKCSSVIWCALRRIDGDDERNPWIGEIDEYPVNLDGIGELDSKVYHLESTT